MNDRKPRRYFHRNRETTPLAEHLKVGQIVLLKLKQSLREAARGRKSLKLKGQRSLPNSKEGQARPTGTGPRFVALSG